MKTIKKVILVSTLFLFFMTPHFLEAQAKKDPVGDGLMVVRKIVGNPMEDYSSTVDLNDDRKQLIMAGQNYQTNYGIYASIEIGDSSLGADFKTFKSMEFEIVNYKPTYFIGIDSVVVSTTKALDGLTFKIYTRALSDKSTYTLNEDVLKNIHFEQGSYLHSERTLNPMFPEFDSRGNPKLMSDGSIACKSDDGKAFDFEFFYKDGQLVVPKENYDIIKLSEEMYLNEMPSGMPGYRCRQSFNKIIF